MTLIRFCRFCRHLAIIDIYRLIGIIIIISFYEITDVAQSGSFHVKLIRLSELLDILRYEISLKPRHWQINTLYSIEWVYRKIRHVYALNSVNEGCVMYSILHMRYEIFLLNNTTSIYMITSHRTVINNISLPLTRITSLLLDRFTRLVLLWTVCWVPLFCYVFFASFTTACDYSQRTSSL